MNVLEVVSGMSAGLLGTILCTSCKSYASGRQLKTNRSAAFSQHAPELTAQDSCRNANYCTLASEHHGLGAASLPQSLLLEQLTEAWGSLLQVKLAAGDMQKELLGPHDSLSSESTIGEPPPHLTT